MSRTPRRSGSPVVDVRAAWQPTRRELLRAAAVAGAGIAFAGPLARGALAAPTVSYDDGSRSIPGGLVGEPERVIIVGAGWAGLTAANALRNAGVDHVVLEGRDRIGGRAHTVDLDGVPIDWPKLGFLVIDQPPMKAETRHGAGHTREPPRGARHWP